MNKSRSEKGSLVFVVATGFIIAMLVVGFFALSSVLGGQRQVNQISDAAVLGVCKQALRKPGVSLTQEEAKNFQEFLDDYSDRDHGRFPDTLKIKGADGKEMTVPNPEVEPKINLLTYNRCVAKALLVSMIAREQGQFNEDLDCVKHAQELCRQAREIGQRLRKELGNQSNYNQIINQAITRNSNQLANGKDRPVTVSVEPGFVFGLDKSSKEGEPTNVYVSDRLQAGIANDKYLSKIVTMTKQDGFGFLTGYRSLWSPQGSEKSNGQSEELMGVAVRNGSQPHLISNRTFATANDAQSRIPEIRDYGVPNAFSYTCELTDATSGKKVRTTSSAVVSSLWTRHPMAIPRGYITIRRGNDGDTEWLTVREMIKRATTGDYKRTVFNSKKQAESDPTYGKDSMGKAPENGLHPIGEPGAAEGSTSKEYPFINDGEIEGFMMDRLLQINPNATHDKLKEVLDKKLGPGTWYVYGHYTGEPQDKDTDTKDGAWDYFAISPNPPSWVDQSEVSELLKADNKADGRIAEFINKNRYAYIQAGSGWHNNLGCVGYDKWPR